jgi:hypothetical protein
MRKQLIGLFSAAALALVVSCSGDDGGAPNKMPAPIKVESGVYTTGYEITQAGRYAAKLWKDGEPYNFADEDGNSFNYIYDFFVTPGYIYVLAQQQREGINVQGVPNFYNGLWVNGRNVLAAEYELKFKGYSPWGNPIYDIISGDSFTKVYAEGDEWHLSGRTMFTNEDQHNDAMLWTSRDGKQILNDTRTRQYSSYSSAESVFVANDSVFVAGVSIQNHLYKATLWVDGAARYLEGATVFKGGGWSIHEVANDVSVDNGNVYVAGTTEGGQTELTTEDGRYAGYIQHRYAVLWENDAPPKVLKGTNNRYARAKSICVEDGDVYVFGVEEEDSAETWIWRDVMWKNGGPAEPIGPEKMIPNPLLRITEEEESSAAGFLSDGDTYSANRGTVLKNGQPLFTLRPKSTGASCIIEQIAVVK